MVDKIFKQADVSILFVVMISLALSLLAFIYVGNWEREQTINFHKEKLNAHVYSLRQALDTMDNLLDSVHSLYNISDNVSRDNFNEFLKGKDFRQHGIQAIEWVAKLPYPQTKTETYYYPVLYTEPQTDSANIACLGHDLSSEPVLRQALEAARDSGKMVSSGAIIFSPRNKLGFRAFIPIYKRNSNPRNPAERRTAIQGFVVGLVLFDDIIESVLRIPRQRTETFVKLIDNKDGRILYSPNWVKTDDQIFEEHSVSIEHGGRSWSIILATKPDKYRLNIAFAWLVLAVGLVFTFGLWRYLFLTLTRARWAEDMVAARTKSLLESNNALDASRRRFEAVFDEAAMGIAQTDQNGNILDSNKALQDLLGYSEQELQQLSLPKLSHLDDVFLGQDLHQQMLAGKHDSYSISKRYISKHAETLWTNQTCSIVRDTAEPFIVNIIEDVTERKCAEQARLEAEKKFRDIFENAIEGIFQCTPSGHYLSVNPAFVRIFGYKSAQEMFSKITDVGQQLYVDSQRYAEFNRLLQTHSRVQNFEYEARCADGGKIWVSETVRVVRNEQGEIQHYEGIVENITERKKIEAKLLYEASHDQLTGLLNRAAFTNHLNQKLQNLSDDFGNFAVLFADLDRFKIVNDSMGHLAGDKLLIQIAERLKNVLANHNSILARFGGDEFAILLDQLHDNEQLEHIVNTIQNQLCQPYFLEHETFNTTVSIGIAIGSPNYKNASEILRDSDTAMYEAKKTGRGRAILFQPGMHTDVLNLLRMEAELRLALEREEFILYYQPIISLATQHIIGFEALIRWNHPTKGIVSPDEFIPIAEETGLILDLGLWVFETACRQLRLWQQKFPLLAELGININVSPIQLKQPQLVNKIADILQRTELKGPCCRVEITESAIMQDPETILRMLNELKSLNVLLYIDDFGTGYTSLSYLKKFPVDGLKIDKSFIREIQPQNDKHNKIARAIIALGAAFDLKVVAEGVENDAQMAVLRAAHCDHVQGFFFSKPICSVSSEYYLRNMLDSLAHSEKKS
jgi:diguanylate cyclase (GGDEF)-like protein/PAS domain S-box-containing protein